MFEFVEGGVCAASGFVAGGIHCGIRKNADKKDLALIYSVVPCTAAAIYTLNKVKGAPISITKAHLLDGRANAMLCNSGNANTCNANGVQIASQMCKSAGEALGIPPQDVIIASTGVIGQPLPLAPIVSSMDALVASMSTGGSLDATEAIMTTDLHPKQSAVKFELDGQTCAIGGICKGSGMIHPNMATMLCFITTDVNITAPLLKKACKSVADETFNMISVDGDTSTNDMLSIMANGQSGAAEISDANDERYTRFCEGLMLVCRSLARAMAADGEGATKLLECSVTGAPSHIAAQRVAKSVVCSSLLKAAMFGEDANWGRVLCAVGYADAEFDVSRVSVAFCSGAGEVQVCEFGVGVDFDEDKAKKILELPEITIKVDMQQGSHSATAYGCDLSHEYVNINGDYRS